MIMTTLITVGPTTQHNNYAPFKLNSAVIYNSS